MSQSRRFRKVVHDRVSEHGQLQHISTVWFCTEHYDGSVRSTVKYSRDDWLLDIGLRSSPTQRAKCV
ncbi:hypothetical protein BgiBS90_029310, partial [Biomphalaria glabrata]